MSEYDDIIHLPRPISQRHAKMSALDRAAQFSPFAALTGFDLAIAETTRQICKEQKTGEGFLDGWEREENRDG